MKNTFVNIYIFFLNIIFCQFIENYLFILYKFPSQFYKQFVNFLILAFKSNSRILITN